MDCGHRALLDGYKSCDCLNKGRERPLVKILVSYIKPGFLFKTDILTPMHLGRAVECDNSKDGMISEQDSEWLHVNCQGDDDFEGNISSVNRRVGFFTGTYWAWKNYDKLGDPEYYGSFGCRKLLDVTALDDLENYDAVVPGEERSASVKDLLVQSHGKRFYDVMMEILRSVHPEDVGPAEKYFAGTHGYYHEMYVLKKNLFFSFCEWLYPCLTWFLANYPEFMETRREKILDDKELVAFTGRENAIDEMYKDIELSEKRDVAFILERLTGYYLSKVIREKSLLYKEVPVVIAGEDARWSALDKKKARLIIETMRQNVRRRING